MSFPQFMQNNMTVEEKKHYGLPLTETDFQQLAEFEDVRIDYRELQDEFDELEREYESLERKNIKLMAQVTELEAKLRKYEPEGKE